EPEAVEGSVPVPDGSCRDCLAGEVREGVGFPDVRLVGGSELGEAELGVHSGGAQAGGFRVKGDGLVRGQEGKGVVYVRGGREEVDRAQVLAVEGLHSSLSSLTNVKLNCGLVQVVTESMG